MNSLGLKTVTTAGTPVQLTTSEIFCSQILIQPVRAGGASGTPPTPNTGVVYLMRGNVAKATGLGSCIAILQVGADALLIRGTAPNSIDLRLFYLDSDTNGDGALVIYA